MPYILYAVNRDHFNKVQISKRRFFHDVLHRCRINSVLYFIIFSFLIYTGKQQNGSCQKKPFFTFTERSFTTQNNTGRKKILAFRNFVWSIDKDRFQNNSRRRRTLDRRSQRYPRNLQRMGIRRVDCAGSRECMSDC